MDYIIITTDPKNSGGVARFYDNVNYFTDAKVVICIIGSRESETNTFLRICKDYLSVIINLFRFTNATIILNPSLQRNSLIRDLPILYICSVLRRSVIVIIHGWNPKLFLKLKRWKKLCKIFLPEVDRVLVLASSFKQDLQTLGITSPCSVISTKSNKIDSWVMSARSSQKIWKDRRNRYIYMSRIEGAKGIFNLVEAFDSFSKTRNVKLDICGSGSQENLLRQTLEKLNNSKIEFHGFVTGSEKENLLKNAGFMILPTAHFEGMPTIIVESLELGVVPIITRVGGVKDHVPGNCCLTLRDQSPPTIEQALVDSNVNDYEQTLKVIEAHVRNSLSSKIIWDEIFSRGDNNANT